MANPLLEAGQSHMAQITPTPSRYARHLPLKGERKGAKLAAGVSSPPSNVGEVACEARWSGGANRRPSFPQERESRRRGEPLPVPLHRLRIAQLNRQFARQHAQGFGGRARAHGEHGLLGDAG